MRFRDDDISRKTKVAELDHVHSLFVKHGVVHTVAVIAEDLWKNVSVVRYLEDPLFDVQLHCWAHNDLTVLQDEKRLRDHLEFGCRMIESLFGKRPSTLFPPWNRADQRLIEVAAVCGLKVSKDKVSLQQYIRAGGDAGDADVNFHYWDKTEAGLIEHALIIFKTKKEEACQQP